MNTQRAPSAGQADPAYILLNDDPLHDGTNDCLDSRDTARKLVRTLRATIESQRSSSFVMAIDAEWGMGKSTLLNLICAELGNENSIRSVRFNAWTAQDSSGVLHALIAKMVDNVDPNIVRRAAHRIARQRGFLSALRITLATVADLLHLSNAAGTLIDSISKTRTPDEMRASIQIVVGEWLKRDNGDGGPRALVVFVDDLDRCSNETVLELCQAIKLYLDLPGLIFVLACDLLVLSRGLAASVRTSGTDAVAYLEKIIQVAYRVPAPDEDQIARLIDQCLRASGTGGLIDDAACNTLAQRTRRNPRRIKRVVNSFTLDYTLDPGWADPGFGVDKLIKCELLYHLYPGFYNVFVADSASGDPGGDFCAYAELVKGPREWKPLAHKVFESYGLGTGESATQLDSLDAALTQLKEELPWPLTDLVRDANLMSLLESLGDSATRTAIRARLIRSPLRSERRINSALFGVSAPQAPVSQQALIAGMQLNALTDALQAQVMQTEGAAATEAAQYEELRLEADANNAAARVADAAREKMQTNQKIMEGFDQIISG